MSTNAEDRRRGSGEGSVEGLGDGPVPEPVAARLEAGRHAPLWIATHRTLDYLRLRWW